MPDAIPSAPTAEMLAQACIREATHLFNLTEDAEDMAHLSMAIRRLAALARSEPPTEGKIQAVAPQRQPIVHEGWAHCPSCGTHEVSLELVCHNSACSQYAHETTVYQGWKPAATPVASEGDSLLPASRPTEPPTGEPVAIDERIRAALAELVALKDMKERLAQLHAMGHGTDYTDYHRRQPLAWANARALLAEARAPGAVPEGWKPVAWVDQETFDGLTKNPHGAIAYHRWLAVGAPDPFQNRTIPLFTPPIEAQAGEPTTLRLFLGAAFPCSTDIDPRGYRWSEAYLDQALAAAQSPQAVASRIDAVDSVQEPKPQFEVRIAGPDDVITFTNELSAHRHANWVNTTYLADRLKHPDDEVLCVATVHGIQEIDK